MAVRLEPVHRETIDRLAPLWQALHAHHQQVAPELAPFVTSETSWANRRRQYIDIASGAWFAAVARDGERDIGYLLGARRPMVWNATFAAPPLLWELVTLFVAEDRRGEGIGSQLLSAMDEFVSRQEIKARLIGVIPANRSAIALYEARGYVPTWLTLTRFQRPAPAERPHRQIAIRAVGEAELDALAPLWLSLHHHHQAVSPDLGPFVPDDDSWPIIRALLSESAAAGLLLAAVEGDRFIGLVSAGVHGAEELLAYADTWVVDAKVAEIKFLVIDQETRGQGIGAALMQAMDRLLAERGVRDQYVGVIAPNEGAIRFYEARGFRPAWLELTKLNAGSMA
jgi:ribosomal protein S18 acetylase RimI-like enzyme